ncbi:type I-F CRISPR-associated protein Csy3 [Vibrio harveyi]|uniref:type I-F CRISPR-associated protein Csy3 n=1 Tax=Vibrio harveyi TaxID=669 RepID=UPI003CE6C8D4
MTKFKLPSLNSYSRSIQPSVGYFYAKNQGDDQLVPIEIITEKLRATFSAFKNGLKETSEKLAMGNIHEIESAYMPEDKDTLVVKFSVKPVANAMAPNNINDASARDILKDFTAAYEKAGGFKYLAERYVRSIVSANFLWRNKSVATNIVVRISTDGEVFEFNVPQNVDDSFFDANKEALQLLTEKFSKGLTDENEFVIFDVEAEAFVGKGQEVFPSQEFLSSTSPSTKDKVLSSITTRSGVRQATFHAHKIGNAIRQIDTWYEEGAEKALAVEPYGIDQAYGLARRHASKNDFYKLMEKKIIPFTEELKSGTDLKDMDPNVHFMVACLIRGGVYSGEGKSK